MQKLKKHLLLHLSLIPEIGSGTIQYIIKQVGQDKLFNLYTYSVADFRQLGVSQNRAERIVAGLLDKRVLDQELIEIEIQGASFVTVLCDEYPKLLKEIDVPPVVLYYQGDVTLFTEQKTLACVGARKAHSYVQDVIAHTVVPMIQDGWTVVSGGALGADTYAHAAALDNGGKTIVVVGSGLYYQYPPKNKLLFQRVVAHGGLVVSSFPMKRQPEAQCFPIRNRIISGLSQGCLVLQAARKSGALITAHFALEQGREVFAVPGPIYDPLSAGCHELIKQGAKLVESTDDIIQELSEFVKIDKVQQLSIQQPVTKVSQGSVNELDQQILRCMVMPVSIGDILLKISVEPQKLQEKLFELSLDGKIEQDCMGLWKRI